MVMEEIRYVAEFTTNHLGNLNLLLKMVDKAAECGCTLIKMQKKDVKSFYTQEKLATKYESPYGHTYGEYREMFEFDHEDFERFDKQCKKNKISWFSTVQDIPSLDFLIEYDLPMYKIASTNIRNKQLLEEMAKKIPIEKEIVISTGGATIDEIDLAVKTFSSFKKLTILHTVAEYPCPMIHCKLGNISELIRKYKSEKVDIGYSGHEEGYLPSIVAVSLGCKMIERHFCISRHSFAHHIECSLEPDEYQKFIQLVSNSTEDELKKYQEMIPKDAMRSWFGMSDVEHSFLIDQKYGHKYLGKSSKMY